MHSKWKRILMGCSIRALIGRFGEPRESIRWNLLSGFPTWTSVVSQQRGFSSRFAVFSCVSIFHLASLPWIDCYQLSHDCLPCSISRRTLTRLDPPISRRGGLRNHAEGNKEQLHDIQYLDIPVYCLTRLFPLQVYQITHANDYSSCYQI